MNTMNDSPKAEVAQPKSIDEKIAEETKLNAELKIAFLRAQEAAKPAKMVEQETGTRWHNSNLRLELLKAMKKEILCR